MEPVAVVVRPSGERLAPLGLCGAGAGVGPFLGQGPVEAFDFAVGRGRSGRVRLCVMAWSRSRSRQAWDLQQAPLSVSTRSTVMPTEAK